VLLKSNGDKADDGTYQGLLWDPATGDSGSDRRYDLRFTRRKTADWSAWI
jgi:hypothetical protein